MARAELRLSVEARETFTRDKSSPRLISHQNYAPELWLLLAHRQSGRKMFARLKFFFS
jgi:hypothetical protein